MSCARAVDFRLNRFESMPLYLAFARVEPSTCVLKYAQTCHAAVYFDQTPLTLPPQRALQWPLGFEKPVDSSGGGGSNDDSDEGACLARSTRCGARRAPPT